MRDLVFILLLTVAAIWYMSKLAGERRECEAKGGVYVQTFGGYACVQGRIP